MKDKEAFSKTVLSVVAITAVIALLWETVYLLRKASMRIVCCFRRRNTGFKRIIKNGADVVE